MNFFEVPCKNVCEVDSYACTDPNHQSYMNVCLGPHPHIKAQLSSSLMNKQGAAEAHQAGALYCSMANANAALAQQKRQDEFKRKVIGDITAKLAPPAKQVRQTYAERIMAEERKALPAPSAEQQDPEVQHTLTVEPGTDGPDTPKTKKLKPDTSATPPASTAKPSPPTTRARNNNSKP